MAESTPTSASSSTTTTPRPSRWRSSPTFALGLADEFPPADEGYGPAGAGGAGPSRAGLALAESLILDEFDLTLVNEMPVDHGLTVPLSVMFGQPDAWPCRSSRCA
jgi:protocatechuate 4,5-dioxygenase beta chain